MQNANGSKLMLLLKLFDKILINPPLAELGSKKTPGPKMAEKRYKEDQEK